MKIDIEKGDTLLCIEDLLTNHGEKCFTKATVYECKGNNYFINDNGIEHRISRPNLIFKYFLPLVVSND